MKYTGQAPALTDEEIETVLKENRRAIVCTHNKDGTIHAVPVDYRYMVLPFPMEQQTYQKLSLH